MKIESNDPLLTAYLLGELDEATRRQVEARLAESPEARATLEESAQIMNGLVAAFAAESSLALDGSQRSRIEASVETPTATMSAESDDLVPFTETAADNEVEAIEPVGRHKRFALWSALAAAACLAVAAILLFSPPLAKYKMAMKSPDVSLAPAPLEWKETAANRALPLTAKEQAPPPAGTMAPELMRRYGLVPGESTSPLQPKAQADSVSTPPTVSLPQLATRDGLARNLSDQLNLHSAPPGLSLDRLHEKSEALAAESRGLHFVPSAQDLSRPLTITATSGNTALRSAVERSQTASYPYYAENRFLSPLTEPLSTFSIDVDTASYANARRFLQQGQWPPRDAVRIEEMINYFSYDYPQPDDGHPFSVNIEVAGCPWNNQHRLMRVGLKGREIASANRPPGNLVFLIDVSGSMAPPERLPLVKQALRQLVRRMNAGDRAGIVVYAGDSRVALPSTPGTNKEQLLAAIDALQAGGSTNGGDGIREAYRMAAQHFIPGGVNRVILCTDGDFNVGVTDPTQLVELIRDSARSGVFLTTLGVGTDNFKDSLMQNLADQGNGNYHYLDTPEEGQKVLVEQLNANLVTIAKDVKIQIEFNPAHVRSYRLIGYEKRLLAARDFNDDRKDAGEIGAGHTVTALYEIVPATIDAPGVHPAEPLKYQPAPARPHPPESRGRRTPTDQAASASELLTLKLRYKKPEESESRLLERVATDHGTSFNASSGDFQFAAAVAGFGMILKGSYHAGELTLDRVHEIARAAKGSDVGGYRAEFLTLIEKAKQLQRRSQ